MAVNTKDQLKKLRELAQGMAEQIKAQSLTEKESDDFLLLIAKNLKRK